MLFQKNIVKKYLATLPLEDINQAWRQYKSYFLNPDIQSNIQQSKEEQFQEGFLRELFVKVLGYTLNPSPDYNLITEQKNETNSKKADGAILLDDKVIGVIELKDHKTTDLSKIEQQAFGYKSQHRDARYVIISNFEKLRLYIDNAVDFREWNLFAMAEDEFNELYLCIAWTQVKKGVALKVKSESVSSEDKVTQQLYKDYSAFKREIFADIVANNTDENTPKEHILLLFKKTQKLLDRLLFIFFAEDCGLLPPNSIVLILDQWEQLKEMDEYVPLYARIKKYFGYLDTGFQGKKYEIFAYNGGLFKPDEILDGLKISDDLLARFTRRLSEYDYASEVDVNILGHIFENSLNEIEEVTAQINSGEKAPAVSKRKRDGVFYTPQYITKYIVENTVGRLCAEKKSGMGIDEAEYFADKNRQMATKKRLMEKLQAYREWLLGITICDPACGSGAFLNAALAFLINEHKLIDEMETKVTGGSIVFQNVENSILENNLYGVDINEESVEIAKLALWLRTAKPHRKLNSLNNNIKCGNSLISDPSIAGEKAFDWQTEFPQVFEKGGFDVVIGNPPYVQTDISQYADYKTQRCGDLYAFFFERGIDILKENGFFGYITPSLYVKGMRYEPLRQYLLLNTTIIEIIDKGDGVFEDVQMPTAITLLQNTKKEGQDWNNYIQGSDILSKLNRNPIKIDNICSVMRGLEIGKDKVLKNKSDVQLLCGENIYRYGIYSYNSITIDTYKEFKKDNFYFTGERVLIRETGSRITAIYLNDNITQNNRSLYSLKIKKEDISPLYILAVINSQLIQFYYQSAFASKTNIFPKIRIGQVKELPIPEIPLADQQPFITLADTMLALNKDLQEKLARFLRRLQENMPGIKINGALETFDNLDFAGFVAELKKQKIKLTLAQQDEWEEYFNQYKTECQSLKTQIATTDKEIDKKVYELYGLTEEEIEVVEGE